MPADDTVCSDEMLVTTSQRIRGHKLED